jgi:hypothetical protein
MAQRLATEYVHASLQLTLSQLMQLIEMFSVTQTDIRAKVLESGTQQIELHCEQNRLVLEFHFEAGFYHANGSYRFMNAEWTNVMRQALRTFKGDAIVHRIYEGFTMIYKYEKGHVTKIIESSIHADKVIYEYKDTIGELEQTFKLQTAEQEIAVLRDSINDLLDLRNMAGDEQICAEIDERLRCVAHKLFVLEA